MPVRCTPRAAPEKPSFWFSGPRASGSSIKSPDKMAEPTTGSGRRARRISRATAVASGLSRLACALPAFYRHRPTLKEAEEEVRAGVERRGETFLAVARERIYADPTSPYLRLLRLAGCDFA